VVWCYPPRLSGAALFLTAAARLDSGVPRLKENPGPFRRTALLGLAILLLVVAGCSRVTLGYNAADFLIERYADNYLALSSDQMSAWEPKLEAGLARHRRDELPYIAAFFDLGFKGARRGFEKTTVNCLLNEFEEVYRRNARLAAAVTAPLLTELSQRQIRGLAEKFRKEQAGDVKDDRKGKARRERKRAEHYIKSVESWVGPLSQAQRQIVGKVAASMPDAGPAWNAYKEGKRRALIRLLSQGASEARIRQFLTDWLADFRDLPPRLQEARIGMRKSIAALFLRLDPSFSPKQRSRFAGRLRDLRDDFLNLQKHPRMASRPCGRAAADARSTTLRPPTPPAAVHCPVRMGAVSPHGRRGDVLTAPPGR